MISRNAISKLLLGSAPVFACMAAFGQEPNQAPPPPPVFPSSGPVAEANPQEYPGPQQGPYQAQQQGPYQGQPAPYQQPYPQQQPQYQQQPPPYQQQPPYQQPPYQQPPVQPQDSRPFPARLQVKPGTWLPIRIEQQLSSDRNQQGESFYATLAEPLVVNGVVVAHRGQAVVGRITDAQKAGRTEGTSRLGLEITGLTTADGEQISVHTRILNQNGQSSVGRDLGAIGQTTAVGAAIGGVSAGSGKGAGIGAGIGAAAGIAGVLLTRGRPTIVYPESLLTFEISAPVEIDTTRSGAFRYADARDYQQGPNYAARRPVPQPRPAYGGPVYGPVYGPGYGYGYPYGYGTGFGIVIGRGYGYGYGYGRRGRW